MYVTKGSFTPALFNLLYLDASSFVQKVQFVWGGVSAQSSFPVDQKSEL